MTVQKFKTISTTNFFGSKLFLNDVNDLKKLSSNIFIPIDHEKPKIVIQLQ